MNPSYNQTKEKNHMIISFNAEKAFTKFQQLVMLNILERSGVQGIYLNIIKAIEASQYPISN